MTPRVNARAARVERFKVAEAWMPAYPETAVWWSGVMEISLCFKAKWTNLDSQDKQGSDLYIQY